MRTQYLLAMMTAAFLAACGGGGGGGGDSGPVGPVQTTVTLGGTAAKGLLAGADVAVLPVNADGSVGTTALATGVTRANGNYSLVFTATAGQPYVVRVTANAGTTHLDEVSGASQPLPVGFTMRSLLTPTGSGPVTATTHVTPFSELAVAAAARASGGLTAANAAQALSTVKQLVGFDPTAVDVKSTTSAISVDEQKLAVLLTAVSKMAADGDLGCATGSGGDKVKCVVDALGSSARIDSLKLTIGSGAGAQDVSAALNGAIGDVLTDPALSGNVSSTVLANVVANLGCTTNCASGSTGGVGSVATAIAGTKLMFNEIRTDWSAMFRRGSTPVTDGAFNKEVAAFEAAMGGVQVPAEMMAKDLGAMLLGVDLFNDYMAGRTSNPSRGKLLGDGFGDDGSADFSGVGATGCTLYKDTDNTNVATTPAEVKSIGCRALYFISRDARSVPGQTTTTEWRHGFTMVPNSDGSFDYTTRARRRVQTCNATGCTITANVALQTDNSGTALPAFAGKLTPTLSGTFGDIRSFSVVGDLPAAFKDGGRTLVNFKHALNVSGTESVATDGSKTAAVTGTLVAYRDATTPEGTLTLKTGTLKQWPVVGGAFEPGEVDLDIVWNVGGSEFEGRLALTDSVADKGALMRAPTKALLSGALRNIAGGATTEFARGSLGLETSGWAAFDATLPISASNTFKAKLTLLVAVSASGRPTLEVSLGAEADAYAADSGGMAQAQLQYRTLVAGKPRQVVTLTAQGSGTGATTFKLSEATSGISFGWTGDQPASIDLMYNVSTKIGTLDTSSGLLTFSDGSFVSLDFGL